MGVRIEYPSPSMRTTSIINDIINTGSKLATGATTNISSKEVSHRRRRSSFEESHRRRTGSVNLSITPSLSSVLNQRKSQKTNSQTKCFTNYYSSSSRKQNQSSTRTNTEHKTNHKAHPLAHSRDTVPRMHYTESISSSTTISSNSSSSSSSSSSNSSTLPTVEIYNNLEDLDLYTEFSLNDVVQFYSPVCDVTEQEVHSTESVSKSSNVLSTSTSSNTTSTNITTTHAYNSIELKHLAGAAVTTRGLCVTDNTENIQCHRQTRHQSLSPNFMLLYSMEQNMKRNSIIPELDVDENLLSKLSVKDIWNLDIPVRATDDEQEEEDEDEAYFNEDPGEYTHVGSGEEQTSQQDSIKLALITRKKLWCNMMQLNRMDVFGGKNLPWNKEFVYSSETSGPVSQKTVKSLVRLNSTTNPWSNLGNNDSCKKNMIKPCGVLNNGRTQYVVKGWCDKRFIS